MPIRSTARCLFAVLACLAATPLAAGRETDSGAAIERFFEGHLVAEGTYQDLRAGTTRQLHVDSVGAWRDGSFHIATDTHFSDGERRQFEWTFRPAGPGRYTGYRADLIGTARAVVAGNEITLKYRAHIATKDGATHDVNFDETYIARGPDTFENTISVSWLFFHVGEAHVLIHRAAK